MEFKIYPVSEYFYTIEFQIEPSLESVTFLENVKSLLLPKLRNNLLEMPIGLNSIGLAFKNEQLLSENYLKEIIHLTVENAVLDTKEAYKSTNSFEIKVKYDGEDLENISKVTGLSFLEIIQIHTSATYKVGMIGFLPGFPYILGLPEVLKIQKKSVPNAALKAGSVAIADVFTGIYPYESPGGWHVIGYTDFQLFNTNISPYSTLKVGDSINFVAV
jgi:KipI family sensor histidine kinase inhibitor